MQRALRPRQAVTAARAPIKENSSCFPGSDGRSSRPTSAPAAGRSPCRRHLLADNVTHQARPGGRDADAAEDATPARQPRRPRPQAAPAPAAAAARRRPRDRRPKPKPSRSLPSRRSRAGTPPSGAGAARKQRATRRRAPPRAPPLPAAKRELLVSVDVSEQRVAVLEDDRVAEVYLERPERRSIAGNIYKGVVDNVLPGMEAAFVEIGLEKNGFLYVDEIVGPELEGTRHGRKIQDLISRGEDVLVQAVKDPMKTKGARLTTEISLPGRFVVFVPHGEGLGVSRRLEDDERKRLQGHPQEARA